MGSCNALILCCLLICVGCSESIKIKVVDSKTKAAIPGASVVRHSEYRDIILGSRDEDEAVGMTDGNGTIVVPKLGRVMTHEVRVTSDGYQPAIAVTTPYSDTITVLSPHIAKAPKLEGGVHVKKGDVVVIELVAQQ
jgi:hypothetical protein